MLSAASLAFVVLIAGWAFYRQDYTGVLGSGRVKVGAGFAKGEAVEEVFGVLSPAGGQTLVYLMCADNGEVDAVVTNRKADTKIGEFATSSTCWTVSATKGGSVTGIRYEWGQSSLVLRDCGGRLGRWS